MAFERQAVVALPGVPEGGSLFQHNMTTVIDDHATIEHAIPLARLYDDVHQLWRRTGVAYNPTLVVAYGGGHGENYWYQESEVWKHPILTQYGPRGILDARARRPVTLPENEWNHISVAREATRLSEQGVSVLIGAHGQREGPAAHWELWSLAQGGMAPIEVIRAGTLNGARALGLDRDLGSLEVGKLADMVVLDQNPLENIRDTTAIAYTIANGRVFDPGMNEVAPRRRTRAPFWFAETGGEGWAARATAAESDGDHGHRGRGLAGEAEPTGAQRSLSAGWPPAAGRPASTAAAASGGGPGPGRGSTVREDR